MKIKICDIRDIETVKICLESGIDYLGFHLINYSELTEKKIYFFNQVKKLVKNNAKLVLVTRDINIDNIINMCLLLNFDYIQLHNKFEYNNLILIKKKLENTKLKTKIIPVISYDEMLKVNILQIANISEFILFDSSYRGGTGATTNYENYYLLKKYENKIKYFIAGGLNCNNIKDIINIIHPYGVDVQSGVEINKMKDFCLIRQFSSIVQGLK